MVRASSSDSSQITYVPFVRDSQNYVNAALVIKTTDSDTAFSYICDWQYKDFGFDTTTTGWNARTVFQLFTLLDYHALGHTQFRIKDSLLFRGDNVTVRLLSTNESAQRAARLSPSVECTFYQIVTCTTRNEARTAAHASPCSVSYQSFCTTIWTYIPDEGGGGGGGGGGETPPQCSTSNPARMQQVTNPCPPGWTPVEEDPNAFDGIPSFDSWYLNGDDQMKADFWRNKNIDTTGLDSCRKLLLKKLVASLSGNPLGKILAKMDRANHNPTDVDKFKIRYWIKPLGGSSGRTDSLSYDPTTGIFSASITLDSTDIADATELYVAGTIIHETIHAYMKSLLYRAFSGINLTQLQAITYDSAF